MHPVLFSIGPITIHTYGVFVALGFASAIAVSVWLSRKEGFPPQAIIDAAFVAIVSAIVGSRVLYVFMNPVYYSENPLDIFKLWEGGLVFSGGLIFAVIVLIFYLRRRKLPTLKAADILAPGLALGQAVGRIGCFSAGCCYGRPTDAPWAVVFKDPQTLALPGIPLHPTQLYAALGGLLVFGILIFLRTRKNFEGQIFIWFLILHSTLRLVVERFRGDPRGFIPGTQMSVTQLLTLLILLGAVTALAFQKSRGTK